MDEIGHRSELSGHLQRRTGFAQTYQTIGLISDYVGEEFGSDTSEALLPGPSGN